MFVNREYAEPNGDQAQREVGLSKQNGCWKSYRRDDGMTTVEYAVGTLAAVAFAGVLLRVLTSDTVQAALSGIVQRALQ